jgi:hypothetical protein
MRFPAQIATTAVAFLLAPALLLCQDNAAGKLQLRHKTIPPRSPANRLRPFLG